MDSQKGLKERFKKWVVKEHCIKIGLEAKMIIFAIILILFVFVIPMNYISNKEAEINEEIDIICQNAWLYECDKLEMAFPFCYSAMAQFERKNCSFRENLSLMEWMTKTERMG